MTTFDWPSYYLLRGQLRDEQGFPVSPEQPRLFKNIVEAEDWLREADIRGSVREPRAY